MTASEHGLSRVVALVDLDAFYAAVEVAEDSSLAGKPLLIGGSPSGRGVVAAASYEARAFGCHSAMSMAKAIRLCPQALVMPGRHWLYREYSERVMEVLRRESVLVEQVSIDEAYVDLTAVSASMEEAEGRAHRMQGRIRVELGLACSVGLAINKLVAKIACESGKPGGFVAVPPGMEAAFLAPLAIERLPGIGPRTAERLHAQGYAVLGDIADAPFSEVMQTLGPWGAVLQQRARGEDNSAVHTGHEPKSLSAEETFARDVDEDGPLLSELERLTRRVADALHAHGVTGRTVTLKLRFADFRTVTRSASRLAATANASILFDEAQRLLSENWKPGEPVRLIGMGVSSLRPVQAPGQLPLPEMTMEGAQATGKGL